MKPTYTLPKYSGKPLFLIIFLMAFCSASLDAQSSLKGNVRDADDQAVQYANVLLLSGIDSSLTRGSVSDENGQFEISNVMSGSYILRAAMTGLNDYYSETGRQVRRRRGGGLHNERHGAWSRGQGAWSMENKACKLLR